MARIDALLDRIHSLEQQLEHERAHSRLLDYELQRKDSHTMATAPFALGDIVQYQPGATIGGDPVAALVIAVHDDPTTPTADLRVFPGYCQGTTDLQKAAYSADGQAGTFSPKGTVSAAQKEATKQAKAAEPKHDVKHG